MQINYARLGDNNQRRVAVVEAIARANRPISPVELNREMDMGMSNIAYYVKTLREKGALVLVKTRQRRGAMEHFYELAKGVVSTNGDGLIEPIVEIVSEALADPTRSESAVTDIAALLQQAGYQPSS